MTALLVTIEPGATLVAATRLMEENHVHHLLVVGGGRMAGILSSADLLKLALMAPTPEDAPDIRVRELMQSRVAVLRETASLREAARALTLGGFHALPVLAADDSPVGMVTTSDLVGILLQQIETHAPISADAAPANAAEADSALSRLLEVHRAAHVYLHSGQSEQQHPRLVRAVELAREATSHRSDALRL